MLLFHIYQTQTVPADLIPWELVSLSSLLDLSSACVSGGGGEDRAVCVCVCVCVFSHLQFHLWAMLDEN